jgi:CubicO group peptidase (beta-lactamase class C family)
MSPTLTLLAISIVSGLLTIEQQTAVTRLDGSRITAAEIDVTVARLMRAAEVTGVGLAILNDGKVVYLRTYGVRDKEKNLPLTENSVMTGPSFTKAAFAYMVMQLVQERILDLDKPVYQYLPKPLPDYPGYQELASDSRRNIETKSGDTSLTPRWLFQKR